MKKIILIVMMFIVTIPTVFAAEDVVVTLPEFNVTLNGALVENEKEPFPFIQYNGITYMPMTWDLSNALGLKSNWTAEDGLVITKAESARVYDPTTEVVNVVGKNYTASVVEFPVTVNGKTIDNSKEEFPLLSFKNVTYFPMTYYFMVTEFESGYSWRDLTGLSVSADSKLEMKIPESKIYTATVDTATLRDKSLIIEDYFKIEYDAFSESYQMYVNFMHKENNKNILNVTADYYDKYGKYYYTEKMISGLPYKSDDYQEYFNSSGVNINSNDTRVEFKFEFLTKNASIAVAQAYQKDHNLMIEIVESKDINKSLLSNDEAVYFMSYYNRCSNYEMIPTDSELPYAAIKHYGQTTNEEGVPYQEFLVLRGDEIIPEFENIEKHMVKVNKFDEYIPTIFEYYAEMNGVVNGKTVDSFALDFIYLFDKNKDMIKVIVVKDVIK